MSQEVVMCMFSPVLKMPIAFLEERNSHRSLDGKEGITLGPECAGG